MYVCIYSGFTEKEAYVCKIVITLKKKNKKIIINLNNPFWMVVYV